MDTKILETVGLTPKEAQVYQVMLKLGSCAVADIIKETADHPQIVYRAIDGLVARGLATTIQQKHRTYVRAEDPKVLLTLEESRLASLRQTVTDLSALQKNSPDAIVRVSKGNEAVRSLRKKAFASLSTGSEILIIGGSGDRNYEVLGTQYFEIERDRIKKKISRRLLTYESERKKLDKNDRYRRYSEFRYLSDKHPVPTSTNIFGDTVAIITWSQEPIVITIESAEVAQSYKYYFESLWKIARE